MTPTTFYKDHEGNVFAFFPKEKWNKLGVFKTSYSRLGQHSPVHPDYLEECTKATPEEYEGLKQELEGLGYKIELV